MLTFRFHPILRDRPGASRQINLAPLCAEHLIGTRCGQNQKLERQLHRQSRVGLAQFQQESGYFRIRQGRVVDTGRWLLWQYLGDPIDGVVPGSMPGRLRPIEDYANALPDPPRRFRSRQPNRRECFEDIGGINRVDRLRSKDGEDMLFERVDPLIPVLGILPGLRMLVMYGIRGLLKRRNGRLCLPAYSVRIAARAGNLSQLRCCLPRVGE